MNCYKDPQGTKFPTMFRSDWDALPEDMKTGNPDDGTAKRLYLEPSNITKLSFVNVIDDVELVYPTMWRRFDKEDESTWPAEDKDYAVIGEDDMMDILKGHQNYFVRARVKIYVELPSLPDWYIFEDEG